MVLLWHLQAPRPISFEFRVILLPDWLTTTERERLTWVIGKKWIHRFPKIFVWKWMQQLRPEFEPRVSITTFCTDNRYTTSTFICIKVIWVIKSNIISGCTIFFYASNLIVLLDSDWKWIDAFWSLYQMKKLLFYSISSMIPINIDFCAIVSQI